MPPADPRDVVWLELQGAHVRLFSDAPEERARDLLAQSERLRSALIAGSWSAGSEPLRTLRVVAFADEDGLQRRFPIPNVSGLALSDIEGQRLLVVDAEREPAESTTVKHELAHALTFEVLVRPPRWLSEGIAQMWQTMRLERGGGAMILGEPPGIRAWLQTHPSLDFARVMATGPEIFTATAEAVHGFYAQSWLLVHTLENRHGEAFDELVRRLARGEQPRAASAAAFPDLDLRRLEEEATASLRGGSGYVFRRVPLPPLDRSAQVRRLSRAEVGELEAELALHSAIVQGKPALFPVASAWARASLAEDPHRLRAGQVALALAPQAEKELLARDMVRHNPAWGRGRVLLAAVLPHGLAQDAERRLALEKAVELAPDLAIALNALAWDQLLSGRSADALPLAVRAVRAGPAEWSHLDTLALALDAQGRCAEAMQVQERALELAPETLPAPTVTGLRQRLDAFRERCAHPQEDVARRVACRTALPPGEASTARYRVEMDGRAVDVRVDGPRSRAGEVERWLSGCLHQPALRGGEPAPADLTLHTEAAMQAPAH